MDHQPIALVTCYSCGSLNKRSGKLCPNCGVTAVPIHREEKTGGQATHYVFETSQRAVDDEDSQQVDDFHFPEVEITPRSLDDLLSTYYDTLEQLKGEGCLFYTMIHNPRTCTNTVRTSGIPEHAVELVDNQIKVHFPLPTKRKVRKRPSSVDTNDGEERRYSCPEPDCDYRTKYAWQVKNHLRQHTGEKPYSCNRCNFRTSDSSGLVKHTRAHDLDTPHRCKICDLGFVKSVGLVCHMRLSHGLTDFELEDDVDAGIGTKKASRVGKLWKCETCGKLSTSRAQHIVHLNVHSGKRPYKCDKCAYRARQLLCLKIHKKSHIDMDSKPIGCDDCAFRTEHYSALSRHRKLFHQENTENKNTHLNPQSFTRIDVQRKMKNVGPWKCAKCDGLEFPTRSKLAKHRKEEHSRGNPHPYTVEGGEGTDACRYQCKRCKFSATNKEEVVAHSFKHYERKHECDTCNFKTNSMSTLNRHKAVIHGVINPNKCSECDFASAKYSDLLQHKKKEHGQSVTSLQCLQCDFTSPSYELMEAHDNFHKGINFTCAICGFRFYSKDEFKVHQGLHEVKKPAVKRSRPAAETKKKLQAISVTNAGGKQLGHIIFASPVLSANILAQPLDKAASQTRPPVGDSVINMLRQLDNKSSAAPAPVTRLATSEEVKKAMPKLIHLLHEGVEGKSVVLQTVKAGELEPSQTVVTKSPDSVSHGQTEQSMSTVDITADSSGDDTASAVVSSIKPTSAKDLEAKNAEVLSASSKGSIKDVPAVAPDPVAVRKPSQSLLKKSRPALYITDKQLQHSESGTSGKPNVAASADAVTLAVGAGSAAPDTGQQQSHSQVVVKREIYEEVVTTSEDNQT